MRDAGRRDGRDESLEQGSSGFRGRRAREARPQPPARIGCERELRHEQYRAADFADGSIHFARGVGENAVRHQARCEPGSLARPVAPLDTDENQQAYTNRGSFLAVYDDVCPTYALYQTDH
jgi:hypothetical protein